MAAPIVVRFTVDGVDDVAKAFRRVEDSVVRGDRAASDSSSRSTRARVSDAEREARAKQQLIDRETREREKAQKTAEKLSENAQKAAVKAAEKSTTETVRLEARAAAEKERIEERSRRQRELGVDRVARLKERYLAEEVRATERAENEKTRIAEAAARARTRFASTVAGAAISGARAGLTRVGGVASGVASTALALGGGFSIADSLQSSMNLQRSAALLSNSAYIPGQNQRVDPATIIARAKAASISTGLDASELVEGTQGYVAKSADLKGGLANMEFMGQIAKATGSKFSDVSNAAGILRVQNKNLDESAMKQMLLDVVMQGKQGSVEMSDLAGSAGKIARTSSAYGGSQTDNQRKLLGLSQIAMRTSGNVNESATVLSNISSDAMKHSTAMGAALGPGTFNAKGQIAKAPEEFLADVMEKSGGNLQKIQAMGFGARSMKMFQALAPTFNEAEAANGGVGSKQGIAAGRAAVLADMQAVTGAKYTDKDLGSDFQNIIKQPAEQFEAALRELKMEVGQQLLPEFVKLIPAIKDMIPLFVDVTKTSLPAFLDLIKSLAEFASANRGIIHDIAAHPIGAILAKEIGFSIAKAGLGEAMRTSIGQSIGGAGIAIGSAVLMIQQLAANDSKVVDSGSGTLKASANARGDLRSGIESGTLTRAEIEEKKKTAAALLQNIGEQEANKGGGGLHIAGVIGAGIADTATLGFAGAQNKVSAAHKDRLATDEKQIAEQKAEYAKLTAAIQNAEKALSKMSATANAANRTAPQASPARGGAL